MESDNIKADFFLLNFRVTSLSLFSGLRSPVIHTNLVRTDQLEITCFKLMLRLMLRWLGFWLTGLLAPEQKHLGSGPNKFADLQTCNDWEVHNRVDQVTHPAGITKTIPSRLKSFQYCGTFGLSTNKQTCFHTKNFSGVQCLVQLVQ